VKPVARCKRCGGVVRAVVGVPLANQRHGGPCGGLLVEPDGRRGGGHAPRPNVRSGYRVRAVVIDVGFSNALDAFAGVRKGMR